MSWFENKRFDLIFFISPYFIAPILLVSFNFLMSGNPFSMTEESALIFFTLFTALFDAPHIFHTFYRTHADAPEYEKNLARNSLTLIAILALTFLCYLGNQEGPFLELLGLYGGWHILRQNIGFTKLYSRIASDPYRDHRIQVLYLNYGFFVFNEKNSLSSLTDYIFPLSGEITATIISSLSYGISSLFILSVILLLRKEITSVKNSLTSI